MTLNTLCLLYIKPDGKYCLEEFNTLEEAEEIYPAVSAICIIDTPLLEIINRE